MKLKMLTRMATMVAAGSLVVGLLAGCSVIPSKDGAADSAVATDTALILTQGDGMPTLTNAEDFLNSVNVTPGGSAGLVVADGKPFALGPQRFDQVKNNDIQHNGQYSQCRYRRHRMSQTLERMGRGRLGVDRRETMVECSIPYCAKWSRLQCCGARVVVSLSMTGLRSVDCW